MVQRRRAGRKRREGIERETNGRASRRASHARPIDPRETAKAQRLARGATPENALHIEHECPLGRLLISGKITRAQYDAGARFRDLDRQYRMVNGIAPPHTRAADWERGGRLLKPDMDPVRVDTIRCGLYAHDGGRPGGMAGNRAYRDLRARGDGAAQLDCRARCVARLSTP